MSRITLTSLEPTIVLTSLSIRAFPIVTAPHAAQFSVAGPPGATGKGIAWKGDYSATTAYVVGDAVLYNGSSYLCEVACTGVDPTETSNWSILAAAAGDWMTLDLGSYS
jgi:hypothetical protein